jgi:putative sporulation protein YyaC
MFNHKPNLFQKIKTDDIRIIHTDQDAANRISSEILNFLPSTLNNRPIVIVCIGTDRSTGDSLGPLIGTFLTDKSNFPFDVYGSLEDPVHALNLDEKLASIKKKYYNPFIIGIDACLGRLKSVGVIQIGKGPVKPGAGVNKELPDVGHMHITGIVNVSGFMEYFVLQNTRLHLVMEMAKTIAEGLYHTGLMYTYRNSVAKYQNLIEQEQKSTN